MKRLALLLLIPVAALAQDGNNANGEDRCDQLGSVCVCSETLNGAMTLPAGAEPRWNPSVSTSKECWNPVDQVGAGTGIFIFNDGGYGSASVARANDIGVPFPSGANPYVYKGEVSGIHQAGFRAATLTDQTMCVRVYRRYDPTTQVDPLCCPPGGQRIKNLQIGHNSPFTHANVENHPGSTVDAKMDCIEPRYRCDHPSCKVYGDGIRYLDIESLCTNFLGVARQNWVRIEVCADALDATVVFRQYITNVTTGETFCQVRHPATGTGYAGPDPAVFNFSMAHMFAQSFGGYGPFWQYMSHAMQATKAYDPTFTIGAAFELEGAGETIMRGHHRLGWLQRIMRDGWRVALFPQVNWS